MSNLADADARRMIAERLDINLLVEAGAGSGKTYSLARRMAAGIVSGKCVVEEMAAVTFTRKAAAELRGRFQLALEEKLADAQGEERARIENALANLEHLVAGTIHSFCARLLRERPVEANIAPGFNEFDELEDEAFRQRAWRDYLSRLRGERSPLLEELQRAGVGAKDLDGAFGTVCTFDEVDFPPGDAQQPDLAAARKATQSFWRRLHALMPKPVDPNAKCKTLEKAVRFRRLFRAAGSGRPADLVAAIACWESAPGVTMCWWAEGRQEQREIRDSLEKLIADFQERTVIPFLAAWREYLYRLIITLLVDARDSVRDERRRALALNYGDLLLAARSLLAGNGSVRRALQRKYRWLFVDEFQDTDPIQAEVMLLLAADEGDTAAASGAGHHLAGVPADALAPLDPYTLALRPGALFVVGDPKQSIYRFRRADIDIYNRVREMIVRNGGKVVALTTSFRARPSLCGWTNEVFSALLPAAATPHQAAFSPLDPDPAWKARRPSKRGERGLRTLTVSEDVPKKEVVQRDALAIAEYIRSEVDAERATWDDFLVLTRKRKHLSEYAAALQDLQIPVEVSGAGAFGRSEAVATLIDLLQALADPADAVAMVAVLRGPLFGISDPDLFAYRQNGGYFSLSASRQPRDVTSEASRRSTAPAANAVSSPVTQALERLGEYLRLSRTLPLAALVEHILDDTGFLALSAADDAGGASAGDLLHAVDLVRGVAEDGGSLADVVGVLDAAIESSEVESVPLEPGRRQVVRVMNLHKAKGLEAPVVFLADPLGGVKKGVNVRIVRDATGARGYLAVIKDVGEYVKELIAHPQGWLEHEQAEMEYVVAEETRLLYVAATRARDLLVVSQWEKEVKGGRPWAALDDHLLDAPELEEAKARRPVRKSKADISPKARMAAAALRAQRRAAAGQPSWAVTSVTNSAQGAGRGFSAGNSSSEHSESSQIGSDQLPVPANAGVEWGSLVHGLLEHAMRKPNASREDLERLARWRTVEHEELRPFVAEAVDLVESAAKMPFWQEARAGGEVHVEVPFAIRLDNGVPPSRRSIPTVLRGVIDLVYRTTDGWQIRDYKTDRFGGDEALAERHAAQLERYKLAWERITKENVAAARIASVRCKTAG